MSESSALAPQPIPLVWKGRHYTLAPLANEDELFFVAQHEAYARNRVEATRALVGDPAYREDLAVHAEMKAGGDFQFGTRLSVRWLWTPDGQAAYFCLLMKKGVATGGVPQPSPPPDPSTLSRAFRDEDEVLNEAWRLCLSRDFPRMAGLLASPAPSSGVTAAPEGTT